jgi:adenylosuccinate lyase
VEWHAVPELTMAAGKAHALLASLLSGLEVCADRMRANMEAAGGYLFSEALMLAFARHVGKQTAHRVVQRLADSAWREGRSFAVIAAEDPDIRVHLKEEEIDRLFSTEAQTGQCQELVDRVLREHPP